MKLLTKAEYEILANAAKPTCSRNKNEFPPNGIEIGFLLMQSGRVQAEYGCPTCGHNHFRATPAGREALKLWPALLAAGLVE